MRTRMLIIALATAAALVLSGCFLLPGPPDGAPSIRGTITSITPGADGLGSMLVEGAVADGTSVDKASVNVTKKTEVLYEGADGWSRYTFAELGVGDTVAVWFTGPVAESYPVQATGGTIVYIP